MSHPLIIRLIVQQVWGTDLGHRNRGLITMALAAVVLSLGACPENLDPTRSSWAQLGSRCVHSTKGASKEAQCAADCASSIVRRPWIANDTGRVAVPTVLCIESQVDYDFLHTWVAREYWTGFRRQGTSDGVTPPADWRSATVHAQGSACSAGTNPWFDSLMSHDGARPLLERRAVHSLNRISVVHLHSRHARSSGVELK